MSKTLIIDTETNALHGYTKLWCAVTYCLETKELRIFDYAKPGYLDELKEYIKDCTLYIGHNFISFDRYVIAHFLHQPLIPVTCIYDTLVCSRLFNSGREGGHSLKRYGAYFYTPKIDYEDWENYDSRIIERCKVDVAITYQLYKHQQKEGKNVSQFAIKLEHEFVDLLCEMKERGFPIDAEGIARELGLAKGKKADIESRLREVFPPRAKRLAEINPKITKTGEFYKNTRGFKVLAEGSSLVQGPFTLIEWEEFNIGSPQQVVERMNAAGWKPVEFTKGGEDGLNPQPKVSAANFDTLPDDAPKEVKTISEYWRLKTRIESMENWLENYNEETGKVHGNIIHIGAITHRCSHNNPNTGNIPNTNGGEIRTYWGFSPESERRLVGVDAKGIQLRILAHLTKGFTNDETFYKAVLHGDPHIDFTLPIVADIAPDLVAYATPEELHHVKQAKTKRFIYAYLLGAGNLKTAAIFGGTKKQGKAIREGFTQAFPGLPQLRGYLASCSAKGWYPTPDGSFIPIKSEHYALSVALQGVEAKVMKLAGVLWRRKSKQEELDAHLIAFVHDEYQIDSHKDCAERAGKLMADSVTKSGQILKLRCPMACNYHIGYNWLETH